MITIDGVSYPNASVVVLTNSAPPVQPPIDPPVPPIVPPATDGLFLGDLYFDGALHYTDPPGVRGTQWCYGRCTIPYNRDGMTINIAYAQHIDPQYSRIVTFTAIPGDFSAQWPQRAEGASGGINLSIITPRSNCLTVQPGSVWYFNAMCSRPQSGSANFLITPGVPTT